MSVPNKITRRGLLKRASALAVVPSVKQHKWGTINQNYGKKPTAIVVGAGAFGGWTALYLLRKGYDVTLYDAWGPGNARASSGGETRLIRCMYGDNQTYFNLARRALTLWQENEVLFGQQLFHPTGLLIFCQMEHYEYAEQARSLYKDANLPLEWISPNEVKKRYPSIRTDDLHHAVYDPSAGFIEAREACVAVAKQVQKEDGQFVLGKIKPSTIKGNMLAGVSDTNGSLHQADCYVFAGGPWLGHFFPELLQNKLRVTRQPTFLFGPPAQLTAASEGQLPTWMNRDIDNNERHYGVPGNDYRGFKIGWAPSEITRFDPTHDDRFVQPQEIELARTLLMHRFPFMKDAPLLESRVCQHTDTPDRHFIMDQLPEAKNVWILGGGSGHAFKHGPALGELASQMILGQQETPSLFSLQRLVNTSGFTTQHH